MKYLTAPVLIFLLFASVCCQDGQSQALKELKVRVYKLADGDSFEGRADGVNYRVRLYGIDAPERGQDFYRKSKDRLGELCAEGPVTIKPRNKDSFGRIVADAYTASGKHINAIMVEEGLAWHFTRYSNSAELASLEQQARNRGIGIWSMQNPVAPWNFRREQRRK
jgi:endonuclease YncB( thermonuclease family)